ncbi:SHOCT domain-containing protein [Halorussus halophilus]|uniref:SHOCT domain-containing protein n=1 Tax=Halorussus halophilus TaxID=2650975 RepID=UPI003743F5E2
MGGGEWNDWSGDQWKQGRKTEDETPDEPTNNKEALETLRDRYARGELTDEQFERKLERLLDTESLEDVEDRARAREREPERSRK